MVFEYSPSDHETRSIPGHVGIHVDFTPILHSRNLLVPQAQCEAMIGENRQSATNEPVEFKK